MATKLKEGLVVRSKNLPEGDWLIINVWESFPKITIGNRMSSYENKFTAIKLNEDGTYNENNEQIQFSTAYVYSGSIDEREIEIVKEMKKIYV